MTTAYAAQSKAQGAQSTISIPFGAATWIWVWSNRTGNTTLNHGTDQFEPMGAFPELRAVFSVHAEPFTVVARADADINQLGDLKGKRVNIGNPGSGQRATMEVVMESMGWTRKDFVLVSELKSAEQSRALCDNKIDAMVFTVGHPSGSVKEATTSCDAVVVPVTGPEIDSLIAARPYYRYAVIPGRLYRGNDDDVSTLFNTRPTFLQEPIRFRADVKALSLVLSASTTITIWPTYSARTLGSLLASSGGASKTITRSE